MKVEYLLGNDARDAISETFKLMRSLITPTMGARGQMAVLDQDMGQPILTDDGVTVARSLNDLGGYNRTIGKPFIEACHMTERNAYDGTTLTALLIDELYDAGYKMIQAGDHPQVAAMKVEDGVAKALLALKKAKLEMKPEFVESIATIATKMPQMGDIMKRCYEMVGKDMNVYVKWVQGELGYTVKHEQGMNLDSGYMSEHLRGAGQNFKEAKLALLKTGLATELLVSKWFQSFPEDGLLPIIYVVPPSMNPEVLRKIREIHEENQMRYQFIFLNASDVDGLYLDLAAISEGKVQDPIAGIKDYTYDMAGSVRNVSIGIVNSALQGDGDVSERVKYYEEALEKSKLEGNPHSRFLIENRLASLTTGIAQVSIGVPTQAGYQPIRLKLDDAVGAVKKSFETGVVIGAGKALHNIASDVPVISDALSGAFNQIISNAGITLEQPLKEDEGIDVVSRNKVNLLEAGILDSYASIFHALVNANSIATNYLKIYMVSKRLEQKKED